MSEKNDLARPYVLDDETQKKIIKHLVDGNYLSTACWAAGTTPQCFNHWRLRYEQGDSVAQRFADFFAAVKRASATAEANAIVDVKAGGNGWQGNAWFLERRFSGRWGKQDRSPKEPPPAKKPLEQMSEEELDERKRELGTRKDRR